MKLLDTEVSNFSAPMESTKPSMEGVDIKPMDVLCGRGKNSFNHVGNRKFRDIVAEAIPGYVTATSRATKSEIVTSIVRLVQENGGRFLKQDTKRKVWYVLNYTQSKEKAGHAIRDATITEESKKQRARKRKMMRAAASGNSPRRNSSASTSSASTASSVPSLEKENNHVHDIESITIKNNQARHQLEPSGCKDDFSLVNTSLTDLTRDIMALDDQPTNPIDCLSSMLMAHFPEKLLPEESLSSSAFEPLPLDDPFNTYIDQLLGPLTGF
ncbi:expressed unknown protein [Seminavis robusta]|uniref:DUF6824 domain-containing protein n=1 Tax=Seminavis robusta TaxID=568900 RepID=A0A9N8HHT1_9STRA|nr:expressed unknown protein [Seminavis robusta]|eukprot:Sro581_g170380.1 n/a (270) ;mRNA; r:50777-51685